MTAGIAETFSPSLLPGDRTGMPVQVKRPDTPTRRRVRLLDSALGLKRTIIHAYASHTAARAQTATGRSVASGRAPVMRRGPVMSRGAVMSRGPVIESRRWRGGRNVRWRQLGFRLSLRGSRLVGGRGLLRAKRRGRNNECGTGQRDSQHDSPPIPYWVGG